MGYPKANISMTDVHGQAQFGGLLPADIWHDFMSPVVTPPCTPLPDPAADPMTYVPFTGQFEESGLARATCPRAPGPPGRRARAAPAAPGAPAGRRAPSRGDDDARDHHAGHHDAGDDHARDHDAGHEHARRRGRRRSGRSHDDDRMSLLLR